MSLFFSGTWSWWRHTGSHWQFTITMLWGDEIFYLDWQLCGCLFSHHPSTLLSSHLSPDLLLMDTVVYSWAQLSCMMYSWHKEMNCGKGANACRIPIPVQSMDPSSVFQGTLCGCNLMLGSDTQMHSQPPYQSLCRCSQGQQPQHTDLAGDGKEKVNFPFSLTVCYQQSWVLL